MKAKKRSHGIKQKVREQKEREKRILMRGITVAILAVTIFISGWLVSPMLSRLLIVPSLEPSAAIVDHLSLTFPNQTFIQTATRMLNQSGYRVDYYPGTEATVELYRNLPSHGYEVILLRTHSAGSSTWGALFTCDRYSMTKYRSEQLADQVVAVSYNEGKELYFGIRPNFVQQCMRGNFADATVIMMGCNGLVGTQMAEAFIQKGAKAYIAWNSSISASHTDQATIHLLRHLLIGKQTLNQAIESTMKEVELESTKDSMLKYYPLQVRDQTLESIAS